MKVNKGSEANS